ncbi:hypothetical protein H5410_049318 [Solanum commersonii]|uniref:Uncharacterized protein n=1 Tax=Solanum commersonii TaxID=4109 RepID=A0A9J5WRZ3_SOLCO|nr:hypothetical protein H5410_049318 [Solanum commersonii]
MSPRASKPLILPIFVATAKTGHLQGQTSPTASKPPILTIFVCYSSRHFKTLATDPGLSPRPKWPIYKVKRSPEQSMTYYGDPIFRCHL